MYDLEQFNIGSKIKEARKKKNMSLEDLGLAIGRTKSTIYKYEESSIMPDFETILLICNKLNMSINELCNFKSEANENSTYNPFNQNIAYLYYVGYKSKLIVSTIKFETKKLGIQTILKNSYKDRNKTQFVNEYIGSLEANKSIAYINLRNNLEVTERFEKIQIIVDLKHQVDEMYIGSINATIDSNIPTTRKCIITLEKYDDRDMLNYIFDKLLISEEELEEIKKLNYWNIPVNTLEEI